VASALAFVIMIFEFSLPFFPPFLRLDFSDIPALLVGFGLGPFSGLMVVGMRNLLHLTITATMGVGELANFLISGTFVLLGSLIFYRTGKAVLGLTVGSFVMVLSSLLVNLYVVIPLYEIVLDLPFEETIAAAREINPAVSSLNTYLAYVIVPFNLIKALSVSLLFYPVYSRIQQSKIYNKYQRS